MNEFFNRRKASGLLLTCALSAQATGWYVDAARPDNKGDAKSPATAWRDFEPFIGKAVAGGDTLYLKRGSRWQNTYVAFYYGGTAAKPFVATAYGDPALPLPSISDTSSDHYWVFGLASSHVVVEQIAVHGPNGLCISTVADSVKDVVIQDMEVSDCQGGIGLGGVDGAIIQRNKVWNIHFPSNLKGGGGGAIGITLDACRNAKVLDNTIRHAIDGKGGDEDGGAIELFRSCTNVEIAGNRAYQTAGFLEMGGVARDHDTDRNIAIHHNVAIEVQNFLWCSVATPKDSSNEWGMGYKEVYVDHNTLAQNSRRSGSAVGVSLHLLDSTQIRLRDNLFTGDSLTASLYFGPFDRAGNLFWSRNFPEIWELPLAVGELSADPLLVADTSTLGYALGTKSPARDAARVLAYPGSLGSLRLPTSPDGKPDIGALEMASAGIVPRASRFQGKLSLEGNRAVWNGWANAAGFLNATFVDPDGRIVFSRRVFHQAGSVVGGWDLPHGRGVRLLEVEMDGIRQCISVPPAQSR